LKHWYSRSPAVKAVGVIPLTAGEQTGSAGLAQIEAYGAKFPSSAQRIKAFQEARRGQVRAATGEIGEDIGLPGFAPATAGARVKQELGAFGQPAPSAGEAELNRLAASLGRAEPDRDLFGGKFKAEFWTSNKNRRAASSATYDNTETQLAAQEGVPKNLYPAAKGLVDVEMRLRGVEDKRVLSTSRGLAAGTGPPPTVTLTPEQRMDLAMKMPAGERAANLWEGGAQQKLADLPTEFVKTYGLDTPRPRTFKDLREIQSRLGERIATAQDDTTRRRLRMLFDAVSDDINDIAGAIGSRELAAANNFHRNEVGVLFGRKTFLRNVMNKTENDKVADALLNTNSPAQVKSILRVVSPEAAGDFRATVLNKLHDAGIDPVSGQFSPERYLRGLGEYSEDTMRAMLGSKYPAFIRARDLLRQEVIPTEQPAVFKRVLGTEDRLALQSFTKENAAADVRQVMGSLSEEAKQQARAGRWSQITQDSVDSRTGQFAFGRFLGKIGDMDPATREAFFGPEVTKKLGNLERVLQRVLSEGGVKEGAQGLGGQIGSMAQIAGTLRYAGGIITGNATVPQVLANGLVLLSPSMIAKLSLSPKGIDLLVHGLQMKPGTLESLKAGGVLAVQMARLLAEQSQAETRAAGDEVQRRRIENIPPGYERTRVYRGAGVERVYPEAEAERDNSVLSRRVQVP